MPNGECCGAYSLGEENLRLKLVDYVYEDIRFLCITLKNILLPPWSGLS
jgi:hypothetical protein